jgi:hypothetical protein
MKSQRAMTEELSITNRGEKLLPIKHLREVKKWLPTTTTSINLLSLRLCSILIYEQ